MNDNLADLFAKSKHHTTIDPVGLHISYVSTGMWFLLGIVFSPFIVFVLLVYGLGRILHFLGIELGLEIEADDGCW